MNKKSKIKAIIAFAIATAFIMPGAVAFANDETTSEVVTSSSDDGGSSILGITWDATLSFNEPGGKHTTAVFGEAPDAHDGPPIDYDYDIMLPPPPAKPPYIRAWFNDGLPVPYDMLWEDYRHYAVSNDYKLWDLGVMWTPADYATPTGITISWDRAALVTAIAGEYNSVALCDGATVVADMLVDTEYFFTASAMIPKDFQIIASYETYLLDVTITGEGTVALEPPRDPPVYESGDTVVLTPTPIDPEDWVFYGWSGPNSGDLVDNLDGTWSITMTSDKEVTAKFIGVGWLAEITIEGTIDPPILTDMTDYVTFGESTTASDGKDMGVDIPYPGTPPAPYVAGWFMTEFAAPYDELEKDIREYPAIPPNGKIWDLWVETDTAGNGETTTVTMTWGDIILQGTEYDYVELHDYLSGSLLADMRAVGAFVFAADHGMGYHFQIICGFNHCPVGVDDEYETNENTPLIVAIPGVLENDYDVDDDPLTVKLLVYSGPGSVDLGTYGSFKYTPAVGFTGDDWFSYEVTDGRCSDEATVTIHVVDLKKIDVQEGWNLISMPAYEESFDKTNIVVEYDDGSGADYYTWDEATTGSNPIILKFTYGWSGEYTNDDLFTRGDGYWMWSYVDCTLLLPSDTPEENHITTFDDGEGWYLVGIPYTEDQNKWDLWIHYCGQDYTWAEAAWNEGIILPHLYDWDRTTQNYELTNTFVSGYGYWMYVYEPCSLKRL